MKNEKPTYPNGTKVRFFLKHLTPGEFGAPEQFLDSVEGEICTIICFATGEEGEPEFEYYDVQFADGKEIAACSGFHLEPIA